MKKKIAFGLLALSAVLSLAGCGFVTVVPIGEEAAYTGETVFDAGAESSSDFAAIAEELAGKAVDLSEAVSAGIDDTVVSGTATIIEFNTDTPKYYLLIDCPEYEGEVKIQAGGVYSGTTVRDAQTLKNFESFTNQTEWSEYAKSINTTIDEEVVAPLALDESAAGKTVTFVGAAEESSGTITITPVSLSVE